MRSIPFLKVRGIRRRWLLNSISILVMILAVMVIAFSLVMKNYYDSSILSDMESKARTASSYFGSYAASSDISSGDYLTIAQDYVSSFEDGTKIELQFLTPDGKVIYSSNGLTLSGTMPETPDLLQLQDKQEITSWTGTSAQTGERITAVSAPLSYDGTVVGIMRYVTSMRLVDRQVTILTLAAAGACLVILVLVYLSNIYFVRSIEDPVKNITGIAQRIAGGSYGIQVEKKFDDEIGDLTDAINDMSLRIKHAESMKSEFISSVSHELRTPLTAINGWGETLLADESNDVQQIKRGVQIMVKESRRLTNMVEELLQFSRLEDGRFTLQVEDTDLQAELEDAVYSYRELFRQDGIALEYSSDRAEYSEVISGDPERLKQVFCNLLDNAAKHGGSGKRIAVHLSQQEGEYVITIRDFGPGIPEAELPYVKQKFYKGSSKARGSGIGLAVCDEIVQRHGGRLDIANAEGGGTVVTVYLPLKKQAEQEL